MTVSTDAILFYGYCWDEETRQPWSIGHEHDQDQDVENWEDRYARVRGVAAPMTLFPERTDEYGRVPKDYTSAEQAVVDEYLAYWDRKRELTGASNCEVSTHCSKESPMPYVCVKASRLHSSRGEMTEVRSLAVDPIWDLQLSEFCEVLGIRTEGRKPAWWLVSDWA
jgi:hypothetical protein